MSLESGAGGHHRHHGQRRMLEESMVLDFLDEALRGSCSVIDLGCGDGYFTKMFLKKCSKVACADLDDTHFGELSSMGIETFKADICTFNQGTYDLVFMSNVFHDLVRSCGESFYENLRQLSRKYVAILDFKLDTPFGPPKFVRIPKEKVIEILQPWGFRFVKEKDLGTHYFLLFEKI